MKKLLEMVKVSRQVLLGLAVIAVVLILGANRIFEGLELSAYDAWFAARGPVKADDRIVIVAIDEDSIRQVGQWPWPRAEYGKLLEKLKDARTVAFDLLLSEQSRAGKDDDAAFAEAIRTHGRVVLGVFAQNARIEKTGQVNTFAQKPVPVLLDAVRAGKMAGQGVVNTPQGDDAVVRAALPVEFETTGSASPSFPLAAVMQYKGYTPDKLNARGQSGTVTAGDLSIPRDRLGQTMINYTGGPGSFKSYSFAAVVNGKVDPAVFKDKMVFVGATAPTLHDVFATPFMKSTVEDSLMPGVEVQANAAATFLNGNPFTRASETTNNLITLVLGLLILGLSVRLKAAWGGVAFLVLAGVHLGATWYAFTAQRYWLDSVMPVTGGFLVYTVATVENYLREAAEKRRVRNLFGRYVSHNVVHELLSHPEMLEMGGKRFNVTILFSDIRGFTSFSETRDPQEVMGRINEYCKEMVELIYKYGGTLDKYMGDGIMAYFGAPLPMDDHAERALKCAYEMRVKMKELHERWKAEGKQVFKIGVGLNSGEVIAGNVGHPDRMEYSLIGSAVNLASRLEGMTKEYAKSEYGGIVFSINTYQLAPKAVEEYHPVDLGEAEVRGMVQKQHIFTM